MAGVLLWNVHGGVAIDRLSALVGEHIVDVIVLLELKGDPRFLATHLPAGNRGPFRVVDPPEGIEPRSTVLTRFRTRLLSRAHDDDRLSIFRLALPLLEEITLAVVHLRSKMHQTDNDLAAHASRCAREIQAYEDRSGHRRTVVLGDFNMNPYEPGLVGSEAFHAISSLRIAQRRTRVIGGEERRLFYNPMWRFLAERAEGVAGTYYYEKGRPHEHFWHVFDQVLLRPDAAELIDVASIDVLLSSGGKTLLDTGGRPDREGASDHLPVYLRIQQQMHDNAT